MLTRLSVLFVGMLLCPLSSVTASDTLASKLAVDSAAALRDPEGRGAAPSNDTCSGARVISALPFSEVVNTAAAAPDAPPGSCNTGGVLVMQNSVWYRWTCPQDCAAVFKAADQQNYDVIVTAYTGTGCANIVEFACADEPEPATITFNAVKNTTYWFKVGDWGSAPGGGDTLVTLTTSLPNETCATATIITTADATFTTNTVVANASPGITNCGFPGSTQTQNDIWYTFTAPTACTVSVTLTPTGFDAILALYRNFGGCNVLVGADCGHSPGPQVRHITVAAGETLSIRVGTYANTPGGGLVTIDFKARAVNDECAGAEFVNCASVTDVHTTFGSNAANEPNYTCIGIPGVNSLWYRFIPSTPTVRLRTLPVAGQPQDTVMAVYSGSCGSLTQIACNDDDLIQPDPATSQIDLTDLTVGVQYYVRVSAFGSLSVGHYQLVLECPANCAPCPFDAISEVETCGDNLNAGCSASPAAYQDIPFNRAVCGTASLQSQNGNLIGDLDAYRVTLPQPGTLQWTVTAQFPVTITMLAPGCPSNVLLTTIGPACQPVSLSLPQPAGQSIVIVRPTNTAPNEPFPCGSIHRYTLAPLFTPSCPGDLNGDNQRDTLDLIIFLGDFGETSPGLPADLNGDGVVNTLDLTSFLGKFSIPCP